VTLQLGGPCINHITYLLTYSSYGDNDDNTIHVQCCRRHIVDIHSVAVDRGAESMCPRVPLKGEPKGGVVTICHKKYTKILSTADAGMDKGKAEHLHSTLHGIQTTLKRSGMDHTV